MSDWIDAFSHLYGEIASWVCGRYSGRQLIGIVFGSIALFVIIGTAIIMVAGKLHWAGLGIVVSISAALAGVSFLLLKKA